LTRIYTRTGDDGSTGLGNGARVPKHAGRVEAYGTVDELNCTIGLVIAGHDLPAPVRSCLEEIQHELFELGSELCIPGRRVLNQQAVNRLEKQLDEFNAPLPALRDFILPGGGSAAAACHLARAVCRRAERRTCLLAEQDTVNEVSLRYLNRLSDLLFVISRMLCRHEGGIEVLWRGNAPEA